MGTFGGILEKNNITIEEFKKVFTVGWVLTDENMLHENMHESERRKRGSLGRKIKGGKCISGIGNMFPCFLWKVKEPTH